MVGSASPNAACTGSPATCDPRNAGSAALLRRLGMAYEGRLRHTMLLRDGWRDSETFGILEDEWRARRRTQSPPDAGTTPLTNS
ncbi:GNAT family protein [Actinopolymorpha sp. NPDC004070]|uniref:GNAT family N-acetyltransferase n=1 Tax=Actinopolymorpha sp. NPDC004070 TaxID=3154548 RepID=UPI0033A26F7B